MCNRVTTDMRSRWQKKKKITMNVSSVCVPGLYFSNVKIYV